MLTLLVIAGLTLVVCRGVGHLGWRILTSLAGIREARGEFFHEALWGLVCTVALVSLYSLFARVALETAALVAVLAAIGYYKAKDVPSSDGGSGAARTEGTKGLSIAAGCLGLGVLFVAAQQTISMDELGYYVPFISWMNHHGAVPGVANIEPRIGFDSSWHVFAALCNGFPLAGVGFNQCNVALYVIFGGLTFGLLARDRATPLTLLALFLVIAANLPWLVPFSFNSPNADYAVMLLTWILLLLVLEDYEAGNLTKLTANKLLATLIQFVLPTIKLSALPVMIGGVAFLALAARQRWGRRYWFIYLSALVAIVVPWVIRTSILTGYLLYPLPAVDVLSVDWKVSHDVVAKAAQWIKDFAFDSLSRARQTAHDLPFFAKWTTWFRYNLRIYDQLLVLALVVSPVLVWWGRKKEWARAGLLWPYALLWVGVAFWLCTAPGGRFVYPYAMLAIAISWIVVLQPFAQKLWRLRIYFVVAAVISQALGIAIYVKLKRGFVDRGEVDLVSSSRWWLQPVGYPVAQYETITVPQSTVPWASIKPGRLGVAPFPYLFETTNRGIAGRGSSLAAGIKVPVPATAAKSP